MGVAVVRYGHVVGVNVAEMSQGRSELAGERLAIRDGCVVTLNTQMERGLQENWLKRLVRHHKGIEVDDRA